MNNSEKPTVFEMFHKVDERGYFSKILSQNILLRNGVGNFNAREMFSSKTRLHGIRGMHIQLSPGGCRKIVWVSKGKILDVVYRFNGIVDSSNLEVFELDARKGQVLYVPANFCHGFQALSDEVIVNYLTDSDYDPMNDVGFRFNSFGFNWPFSPSIVSERDSKLPTLEEFLNRV